MGAADSAGSVFIPALLVFGVISIVAALPPGVRDAAPPAIPRSKVPVVTALLGGLIFLAVSNYAHHLMKRAAPIADPPQSAPAVPVRAK